MQLYFMGIDLFFFYDWSVEFWNCSDSVVFLGGGVHFIIQFRWINGS